MNDGYSKKAFVKNVYIELPFYRYNHGPIELGDKSDEERFIGRAKETKQLLNILNHSDKSGAYLVTGYRGMGKTSFVNRTLNLYDSKRERTKVVTICLSQNKIDLKDIYKQIAQGLKNELFQNRFDRYESLVMPLVILLVLSTLSIITGCFFFRDSISQNLLGITVIGFFLSGLLTYLFVEYNLQNKLENDDKFRVYKRIEDLLFRANSELVQEKGTQGAGNRFILGFISKKTRKFPLATARELEQELIKILIDYKRCKNEKEVIIIFDELDKVELGTRTQFYHEENRENDFTDSDASRKRRKLIISILGSLKHFVTRAEARFIFIAGREMFDASLADINDRQSSISSIFHQIINVDSLLKDKSYKNSRGITNSIEQYVKELILPSPFYGNLLGTGYNDVPFLKKYYELLPDSFNDEAKQKIIYVLQQFIIYLTYRSSGAPNKLNKLIEDLLVNEPTTPHKWKYIKVNSNKLKAVPRHPQNPRKTRNSGLYLKISASNQYRYAFISYLYRPFILTYSHYLKEYSDQVLVSTPYLMDHLIKFHPFAFSLQDVELIPEVLSSNRQPIIRYFTDEIVSFLNKNLIRNTEIGLFDYKYFKKVQNELEFLSKIFEDESAAFNFTLDENHEVKLQIRSRIRDLRSIYKDYLPINGNKQVFSISYLNTILGDLCFFDQEYSEAIVSYQDALQSIRNYSDEKDEIEILIISLRVNLKIGLTYEKMKSYELALGYYSKVANESKIFFSKLSDKINLYNSNTKFNPKSINLISSSSVNDLLQICVQGFLAKLYLQEKFSVEGVTMNKVIYTQLAFQKMIRISSRVLRNSNTEIFSNFYTNVGTLLFFKNANYEDSNVSDFFDKKVMKRIDFHRLELEYLFTNNRTSGTNKIGFSPYAYTCYKVTLLNQIYGNYSRLVTSKSLDEKKLSLPSILNQLKLIVLNISSESSESKNHKASSKSKLKILAITLSKIGDVILSFLPTSLSNIEKENNINNQVNLIELFKPLLEKKDLESNLLFFGNEYFLSFDHESNGIKFDDLASAESANYTTTQILLFLIRIYFLSSKIYEKSGINVSASFQLRKILHVLRISVRIDNEDEDTKRCFELIDNFFMRKILKIISWNSSSTDRPQTDKFEAFFGDEGIIHNKRLTKSIYKNISNSPETKEALLFYAPIRIKSWNFESILSSVENISNFNKRVFQKSLPWFEEQSLNDPYNNISSQFTRILELSFQERCNNRILKKYFSNFFKNASGLTIDNKWNKEKYYQYKSNQNIDERKEMIFKIFNEYWFQYKKDEKAISKKEMYKYFGELIAGSIYSLYEIIRIINISGVSYMLSYSYLGHFHRKLGIWMRLYTYLRILNKFEKITFDIKKITGDMIGPDSLRTLDSTSQFQLAAQNYRKAIQLHTQGETYQRQIRGLLYLEDDFNDNLFHYCAAVERQQIISGRLSNHIEYIEGITEESQMLNMDRFWNV